MALYIYSTCDRVCDDRAYHVGKPMPSIPPDTVTKVQADGDELVYIHDHFMSIPRHATKRIQTWRGDIAKFIVEHLW